MKNNKGLTLIEFITSFTLASIIIILLLNVVVVLRQLYNNASFKSEVYITQSGLSNKLNQKFTYNSLLAYTMIDANKYEFIFTDGTYKLIMDKEAKTISFGSYTYKFPSNCNLGDIKISSKTYSVATGDDGIFILNIPITDNRYKNKKFDINLVYMYNSSIIDL